MQLEKLTDLTAAAVPCPYCAIGLEPTYVRVAGLAIVVDGHCPHCGRDFAFDWPAGHALLHPVAVDRGSGALHAGGREWYARRFAHCLASEASPASVEITVSGVCKEGGRGVLVNCVDFRYSHVLLKLISAARHVAESVDEDVVVVVPRLLRWLVPAGAVVVEVNLPLSQGTEWVEGLDGIVDQVLSPSAGVRISPAVSQPETSKICVLRKPPARSRITSTNIADAVSWWAPTEQT